MDALIEPRDPLFLALLKAGKICRYPDCQLQAGHDVKWVIVRDQHGNRVKDKNGKDKKIAEVNQATHCWYHGHRKAQGR